MQLLPARKNTKNYDARMHQLDQVENLFKMESLKEKDVILFQKLVQDSLKSLNFIVLIKLFQTMDIHHNSIYLENLDS